MPAESRMRQTVVKMLRHCHALSIVNGVGSGTPDVNLSYGWIELKTLPYWPKKAETVVQVPHFTQEQRLWLKRRCAAPLGEAYLLLKVEQDWVMFSGDTAAEFVGKVNKLQLNQRCMFWATTLPDLEKKLHETFP